MSSQHERRWDSVEQRWDNGDVSRDSCRFVLFNLPFFLFISLPVSGPGLASEVDGARLISDSELNFNTGKSIRYFTPTPHIFTAPWAPITTPKESVFKIHVTCCHSLEGRSKPAAFFFCPHLPSSSSLQWLRLQAERRPVPAGLCARPGVLRWPLRSSGALSCRHHLPSQQRVSKLPSRDSGGGLLAEFWHLHHLWVHVYMSKCEAFIS